MARLGRVRILAFAAAAVSCLTAAAAFAAPNDDSDFVVDLSPTIRRAQPPAAAQAQGAYRRLVGKVYEGALPIGGWKELGGGLLADPIWVDQYQGPDGSSLVLSLLALPRRPGSDQGTFKVVDVLFVPPLESGLELSLICSSAGNPNQKFIAVVRPEPNELWRDIRRAWRVEMTSGRVSPAAPTGVQCANESWGE